MSGSPQKPPADVDAVTAHFSHTLVCWGMTGPSQPKQITDYRLHYASPNKDPNKNEQGETTGRRNADEGLWSD